MSFMINENKSCSFCKFYIKTNVVNFTNTSHLSFNCSNIKFQCINIVTFDKFYFVNFPFDLQIMLF